MDSSFVQLLSSYSIIKNVKDLVLIVFLPEIMISQGNVQIASLFWIG